MSIPTCQGDSGYWVWRHGEGWSKKECEIAEEEDERWKTVNGRDNVDSLKTISTKE